MDFFYFKLCLEKNGFIVEEFLCKMDRIFETLMKETFFSQERNFFVTLVISYVTSRINKSGLNQF